MSDRITTNAVTVNTQDGVKVFSLTGKVWDQVTNSETPAVAVLRPSKGRTQRAGTAERARPRPAANPAASITTVDDTNPRLNPILSTPAGNSPPWAAP